MGARPRDLFSFLLVPGAQRRGEPGAARAFAFDANKMGFRHKKSATLKWDVMHVPGKRPGTWDEESARSGGSVLLLCVSLLCPQTNWGLCTGWDVVDPHSLPLL